MSDIEVFTVLGLLITLAVAVGSAQWRISQTNRDLENKIQVRLDNMSEKMGTMDRLLATAVANAAASDRVMTAKLEPIVRALERIEVDLHIVRKQVKHDILKNPSSSGDFFGE
ncbi:MAG: hypothetical protein ACREQ5_04240 [Candidatus Dormibacteria bacterium]